MVLKRRLRDPNITNDIEDFLICKHIQMSIKEFKRLPFMEYMRYKMIFRGIQTEKPELLIGI